MEPANITNDAMQQGQQMAATAIGNHAMAAANSQPLPAIAPLAKEASALLSTNNDRPVAVVQALSVRGVEYTMMMLCLWICAGAFMTALLILINGGASFMSLSFPAALLVVCGPIFSWFFIRLKKAELADPSLVMDPSRRRLTQFTQVFAFAACVFNVIAFVYLIMTKIAGEYSGSLVKSLLNLLAVLAVAGSLLAYYWRDEHRKVS